MSESSSAGAQSAHQPISQGEEVARSVCSVCHRVAADEWYGDFAQVDDAEVRVLLEKAQARSETTPA